MRSRLSPLLLLLLSAAHSATFALPAPNGQEVVFTIGEDVVVRNPPRFGVNIQPPAMSHWNTEPWHNEWWQGATINSIATRWRGVASGGSETTLENNKEPRLGYWDVFRTGYFDGGKIRVYRLVDGKMTLLRSGGIARFDAFKSERNTLTFSEPGPAVREGDLYFLDIVRTEVPAESTRTWQANPGWLLASYQLPQNNAAKLVGAGVRLALSSDTPTGGGDASLAITVPDSLGESVPVGYWLHGNQQLDWPRLRPGKSYRLSLWLKLTERPSARVSVRAGKLAEKEFAVSSQWTKYTLDLVGGPPQDTVERLEIIAHEPGTLLVDNVSLVQTDGPAPGKFYPEVLETLRRFRPSTLRLWTLQNNTGSGQFLDDALSPAAATRVLFREQNGAAAANPLGLHELLTLCAEVGSDPWIISSVYFSEEENRNLIEYLAGPADTPYGAKRAAWGQPKPWTEIFSRIKIEMGNETWNPSFQPQGFPFKGAIYGAYSEFMFQAMKSSPWFQAEKFKLVINGWAAQPQNDQWSYGANALRACPSADAIDIAYYTGGWDAVGLLKADSPEEGWMNALTYSRRMLAPLSLKFKATADAIADEQGRPGGVECLVYEAGPGYTLPGPGKLNREEQEQGKSLAHAINALDIFMSNLREGYGDQSFYEFKNGHYWASHNRQWGEHIAWKALGLRNALLTGDLVSARVEKMVTLDLPETQADTLHQTNSAIVKAKTFPALPGLPLVDCYPFRDGGKLSILLLSRRLDAPTSVTIRLPFTPAGNCLLHTLTADRPGAHNIDEELVQVRSETLAGATREHKLQIPPHAILVLQFTAR